MFCHSLPFSDVSDFDLFVSIRCARIEKSGPGADTYAVAVFLDEHHAFIIFVQLQPQGCAFQFYPREHGLACHCSRALSLTAVSVLSSRNSIAQWLSCQAQR